MDYTKQAIDISEELMQHYSSLTEKDALHAAVIIQQNRLFGFANVIDDSGKYPIAMEKIAMELEHIAKAIYDTQDNVQ